jgi:ABC-type transport system substrate-binding protein
MTMDSNYWSQMLATRVGRRRALIGVGGSAAAAAFLAACGGDDDSPATPAGSGVTATGASSGSVAPSQSGLVSMPEDTTSQAKRGGVLTFELLREPLHFDGQAQGQVQLNQPNSLAYASLVRNKMGYMEPSAFTEVEANTASSWELSPDKLTLTLKLRDGVHWHDRPPVNGRPFVAEDVAASWQRYITLPSNNRAANANEFNPGAPILSVEAADDSTVVIRLAAPATYLLQRIASMITGELGSGLSYPRETGDGFDPTKDQIGTGGFELEKWEPSVSMRYRRAPDHWDPTTPYFDELNFALIPEYSARLAQLKNGTLLTMVVPPPDMLQTIKETPAIKMFTDIAARNSPGQGNRAFGWWDINGQRSPFFDERVRQALSMSVDRDEMINAFFNVDNFESAGISIDTFYFTDIGYLPGWTLDPRDTASFGENAKYYAHNPDDSVALLKAAGYDGNFPEFPSNQVQVVFGATYTEQAEVLDNYAREVGFKPVARPVDYNLDYLPHIVTQRGRYEGTCFHIGATPSPDAVDYYTWRFWSQAGPTSGSIGLDSDPGGLGVDHEVDGLIEKAKAEFDTEAQMDLVHDLQRILAKHQYSITAPGLATSFRLAYPGLGNFQVFQGDSRAINQGFYTWWEDRSKAPFA